MRVRIALFLWLLSVSVVSAGSTVEEDLERYCELYNPVSWRSLGDNPDLNQIANHILEQQQYVVRDENLRQALSTVDIATFTAFHHSVRKSIGALLGEPWQCTHFDAFFTPAREYVTVSLERLVKKPVDPNADNVITIALAREGTIFIDHSTLMERSKLDEAIQKALAGRKPSDVTFYLSFNDDSNGLFVGEVLAELAEAGVDKVRVFR